MLPAGMVLRFGPFTFDVTSGRLYRGKTRVPLSETLERILACLLAHAGDIVTKEELIQAGWQGAAIGDNTLDQAISRLRKLLGDAAKGGTYIQTVPHHGYRFCAAVHRNAPEMPEAPAASLEAELEPFLAFEQGRAALHTLGRDDVVTARDAFTGIIREHPDYAAAYVELTLSCGLAFESSLSGPAPDFETLRAGIEAATMACTIAPDSGDAWGAFAYVVHLSGQDDRARAAARKALSLETSNWRALLGAAYALWGQERLTATERVLKLRPNLALAHWQRVTVFIPRMAFTAAFDEAAAGCAAQDAQVPGSPFAGLGLHLHLGQLWLAHDGFDDAYEEFQRELRRPDRGQVYGPLCDSNTEYAIGALFERQGKIAEAKAAYGRALAILPSHPSASAALLGVVPASAQGMAAVVARAIILTRANRHDEAAQSYIEGMLQAKFLHDGWMLPVEPLLNALARLEIWTRALALAAARAA